MIAVDTNVPVRYLVRDDRAKAEAAWALLQSAMAAKPAYVCPEVVVELVWVVNQDGFREAVSRVQPRPR